MTVSTISDGWSHEPEDEGIYLVVEVSNELGHHEPEDDRIVALCVQMRYA